MCKNELVDTMILIDCCKNKSKKPVIFCEMSMFEMLKNKNEKQRFKTFKDLDLFVKESHSEMLISSETNVDVFDSREIKERYKDALDICNRCAHAVANSFLYFCTMIVQLLLLQKGYELLQPNDKQNYEESIEGILELSSNLEKELQEIDITYATERQKVISIDENIEKLQKRLNRLREEQSNIEKQKEEAVSTKGNIQVEINKIVEQNQELSKIITEFAELNKDDQKYIDDLNFDITNLKISVSSFDESEASIQEIQERINQELENANQSIKNKEMQIEQIKKDNEELQKSIEGTLQKIEEVKSNVQNSSSKIEELKQERTLKNEKLAVLEIRNHIAWYLKGMPNSNEIKNKIFLQKHISDIIEILNEYKTYIYELES